MKPPVNSQGTGLGGSAQGLQRRCTWPASISRRNFLHSGLVGVTGIWLGDQLSQSAVAETLASKADAVIQIWMWGGSCHLDTFDPKPQAGQDYCGPLNSSIGTNVPGIRIGQLLPQLGKQAQRYSIIRSMTHGVNGHETASYMVQTGRKSEDELVYPCVGSVVSLFKGYGAGYDSLIPPYIVLTQPQGRFSEAGFLGSRYKPFATGGDPNRPRFVVEGVVAEGISDERQKSRRKLLQGLSTYEKAMQGKPVLEPFRQCDEQAYELILGDAGKVFDLSQEKDELRNLYGRSTFGQSCLMARRLIQRGVRYVTINYGGWDTHKEHFETMRRKLPEFDRGLGTLLEDLANLGMLDRTIVWCLGEFGRTPRVQWEAPWNGGRGHYGQVFSCLLAGGGFQGGQVVGASDARGEAVADRPVYPWDLIASIYQQLGIDPDGELPHPQGLKVRVTPPASNDLPTGGRLAEIM